jgi:hypothetical protein
MESIKALQKRYCSRAMLIAIAGAMVFIMLGYKPQARGLVLGTLFSVINFVLMGQTLKARIGITRRRATLMALLSVLSRFGLLAVPLVIALLYEPYHIVTAVVGLFMVQVAIFLEPVTILLWKSSVNAKNSGNNFNG